MDYDVVILGGGIIGCATAYELSKYNLNIALIEKDYDIADNVAFVNSAIVFDGTDSRDSMTAKLEITGNKMLDDISKKLNVPFKRFGTFIIGVTDEDEKKLQYIYERSKKIGIDDVFIMTGEESYKIEPSLKKNVNLNIKKAIYSANTGVICPYDLALAYGEVAFDNGVNFKLNEKVLSIQKINRGYRVETKKNKITCKIVIDTTPKNNKDDYANTNEEKIINNQKTKYFLMDKEMETSLSNIIFTINNQDENIYSFPMLQGGTISAVNANKNMDNNEAIGKTSSIFNWFEENNINTFYEENYYNNQILIDDSQVDKGYIKVEVKHYAEVTMAPAIAKLVCETVVGNINCKLKRDFNDKRREFYRFRELSNEKINEIIKEDSRYGKIVCICNKVTEGEIVNAIRRPLGARTVEGVKRRTGVTLGSCQGSYCMSKIVSILSRETNKNPLDIVKDSKKSKILLSRIKEFDDFDKLSINELSRTDFKEKGNTKEILTTLVRVKGSKIGVLPVKSSMPIDKNMWLKCSEALSRIYVGLPVKMGDVICKNILNTGVDIISAKNMKVIKD